MAIGRIVRENPDLIPIFLKNGLTCIGCPMAAMETLEQGALSHGIDPEGLLKELNSSRKNSDTKERKEPTGKKTKKKAKK
jgi:hybrid cluster-associated redox disulfide protein